MDNLALAGGCLIFVDDRIGSADMAAPLRGRICIDRELLAWAGGLFEGEGCITISHKSATLSLNTTDEDTARKFAAIVQMGRVTGPHLVNGGRNKSKWTWYVNGFDYTQACVAMLWDGLGIRRRQRAAEVLAIARPSPASNRRKETCIRGHELSGDNLMIIAASGHRRCRTCYNTGRRKKTREKALARERASLAAAA